jgi:serine/threonine-protein kinase
LTQEAEEEVTRITGGKVDDEDATLREDQPAADTLAEQRKLEGLFDSTGDSQGSSLSSLTGLASTELAPTLTPLQTLLSEEIQRTRVFARIAIVVALTVAIVSPMLDSDPFAERLLLAGMGLIVLACAALAWVIRQDDGYTMPRVIATGYACIAGAFTGIYFFGPFSPGPVVIPFGLYFFSLAQSFRATLATYLTCAGLYAALCVGTMTGALQDRGIVNAISVGAEDKLVMLFVVEAIFFATFVIGRATRRASVEAVERHDRDVRSLTKREALLREARQELELALRAGGVGRFTDVALGSFELGTVIGRGAMGEVYEAVHKQSGDRAAVKVLRPEIVTDPDHVRRFLREAKVASRLDVVEVVRVLEVGGLEAPTPFLAMEFLEGQDLAEVLRDERRLKMRHVVQLMRDVARGLAAAQEAGIVHRDLKPRNLFRAKMPGGRRWKILDFGVSKLVDMRGTITEGALIGTPAYMAPEQARGDPVDHRADLYALGIICYRALTGRPAFTAAGVTDMIYRVINTTPPLPSSVARSLSPSVDAFLRVAIAKHPADRFQSASAMAEAFEHAAQGRDSHHIRQRAELLNATMPWDHRGDPIEAARRNEPRY